MEICDKVARDFQIQLGSDTVPKLMLKHTTENTNASSSATRPITNTTLNYTGKILIDLSKENNGSMQLEYIHDGANRLEEIRLPNDVKLTHDCIGYLLKLSIEKSIDFIQMFDVSMMLSNGAFDDNASMECALEKLAEWQEYASSMAIFDVDSLIGVSANVSDSSMGQSNSYSITNNRMWHQVVIQTANSNLSSSSSAAAAAARKKHKWVVVVSKSEFVCEQFKLLSKFPQTESERREVEENAKGRVCRNCEMMFMNGKNNIDSCAYHDGPLVATSLTADQMCHIPRRSLEIDFQAAMPEKRPDMFKNYVYLCCFQGYNSMGCKKHFHSETIDRKDRVKYSKYFSSS